MFSLIVYFHGTKAQSVGYKRAQELIVIACHINHTGATLGVSQDTAYYISVALLPSQSVLLDFPAVYDIAYEI
jgi:hypothetical protein